MTGVDRMAAGVGRGGGWLRRIDPLIGPVAAAVLAAATGFFCYAMPNRIVTPLLTMDGPPPTAGVRGAFALVAALVIGILTWGLFRLIDRPAAPAPVPLALTQDAAPVLRRADAHPDAPARRPIFAGSDLGTPFDMLEPGPEWGAVSTVALPSFAVLEEADPTISSSPPISSPPPAVPPVANTDTPSLADMVDRIEAGLSATSSQEGGSSARSLPPYEGDLGEAVARIERGTSHR